MVPILFPFFFFNDTATTEIYTLSLHDALPISPVKMRHGLSTSGADGYCASPWRWRRRKCAAWNFRWRDRKSTRLNSSHSQISYAVFCLKKKKKTKNNVGYHRGDESKPLTSSVY